MELLLIRTTKTDKSTIGKLYINPQPMECFILEDTDRGLTSDMPLDMIKELKVFGKTAIPSGRYEIAITFSNRFQKYLPLLLNVPGFEGARIHSLNTPEQTLGCLGTGTTAGVDCVYGSRIAFNSLFSKLKSVEKKEKIFITIQNGVAL